MHSLIRMGLRRTFEQKIGKVIYSTTLYEKEKRATITMFNEGNHVDALLMVPFEKEAEHEFIITKKILPFLNNIGKGLVI